MRLCRIYGQPPSWFDAQSLDDQERMLGWLRWSDEEAAAASRG